MGKNGYTVVEITPERNDALVSKMDFGLLYQRKAEIHGTCIKLFCQNPDFVDMWAENFSPMGENVRPHGRIFSLEDSSKKLKVLYEPISKTVFLYNCKYYGWLKSIALALASEHLFDSPSVEGRRYPIHGSYIDFSGRGVAIIGRPKAGKTTLTYGLLCSSRDSNFLTDDWFFVRFMGEGVRAFSAEKNSYAGPDIADNWPELKPRIRSIKKDGHGRAIVDISRLFGSSRIRTQSELFAVVILTRDKNLPVWTELGQKEAADMLAKWDFCNPHQLRRISRRKREQTEFFRSLLGKVPAYLLNTIETPSQSLGRIEAALGKIRK